MRLPGRGRAPQPPSPDAPAPGTTEPVTADAAPGSDAAVETPYAPALATGTTKTKVPLYPRLLRLRHVRPNAWQRAALGEGALGVAVLLVLADLATAWTLVALPVAVAVVVKAHDGLAGLLQTPAPRD